MSTTTLLPGRRTTALLLVVAAVLEVVEQLLSPLDGSSTVKDLDAIAAHQGVFVLSVLIGTLATLLYAPGFLGLAQQCRAASPRLATVAGWSAIVSMSGFLAIRFGQAFELAGVRHGLDHRQLARTIDDVASNPIGAVVLIAFLGGALVGTVLLGVVAWRAGLPKPAAVLLGVFQVGDFLLPDHPVPVSHVLLLVSLTWIGAALWTQERRDSSASPAARTNSTATDEPVMS